MNDPIRNKGQRRIRVDLIDQSDGERVHTVFDEVHSELTRAMAERVAYALTDPMDREERALAEGYDVMLILWDGLYEEHVATVTHDGLWV